MLTVRLRRWCFRYLGEWLPQLVGRWAYRLWIKTQRHPYPPRELRYLHSAQRSTLRVNGLAVAVYRWGQGQPVLLVHGWNGRGTQLGAWIEPLVRVGYQVVAFDAPGHGQSAGQHSPIFLFVDSLQAVLHSLGPCQAIISHSFGVPCLLMVLAQSPQSPPVRCCVALGAPATTQGLIQRFGAYWGLPPASQQALQRRVEHLWGPTVWQQTSALNLAPQVAVPALIIHDLQDQDVPYPESQQLHAHWRGSELWLTEHLGHRRILRSRQVLERVTQFIQAH